MESEEVLNGEEKGDRVQFVRGRYNQSYGSCGQQYI